MGTVMADLDIFYIGSLVSFIIALMRSSRRFFWRPSDDEYTSKCGSAAIQECDDFMEFGGSKITVEDSRANDR